MGTTREEILDRAWELVAERGAGVSMADIAVATGVSRQSVYLHFTTRGGLLVALVERADERFGIRESLVTALDVLDPAERLDACLRAWFAFVPRILPVARDLIRLRATDPDAATAWEGRMAELRGAHRRLIQSLKRDAALAEGWSVKEATDYLWASSSVQIWELLTTERNWSAQRTSTMLRETIATALLA